MRIGQGFDAHAFEEGRKLILAGINILHSRGMGGHSDGDVVIHSLCDALLGAAALGDIGQYFPSTKEYKDIDSRILLRKVNELVTAQNFQINNIDITIIAQEPKLLPYFESMRNNLSADLRLQINQVSIKATTTDYLGFTGRKEGIAAFSLASISPKSPVFEIT